MSSESFQEKTESATPRRRQEARRKGQIAKSPELTTAAILLATGGLLALTGPLAARGLAELLGNALSTLAIAPRDIGGTVSLVRALLLGGTLAVTPLLAGLAITGLAVAGLQGQGVLTLHPLQPDWSRISPWKGMQRIWGVRAIAELAKSLLKVSVVALAMGLSLRHAWNDITALGQQDLPALVRALDAFAVRLLLTAGAAYVVLAAADYAFQVWQHERGLRMTKEEVRREQKETDGDPLVRSRLRSLSRAMQRRQMFGDVPKADVIITNPTHIAVALRYDPLVSPAPIVLAMGQRKIAARIRAIAEAAGVPIVENRPLARALLAAGRIGLPIPPELYVTVAEILAFVYRRRAAGPDWKGSTVV
jgi:flagellar biosynthetic protein FlhB